MKKTLIFLFQLTVLIVKSQVNIVPNSGFEIHSNCPDYPGQINYATGWNNVNLVYNNPSVGTPDYFHACGSASLGYNTVPPNLFDGVCMPHTGSGMAGTIIYNLPYPEYREYISIKLTETMLPGTTYTVSFWLTNGNPALSPYLIKNVGVHFSVNPLSQTGWNLIGLVPTYEITNYSGSNSWVNYTFNVNPTSNWNYLTVGSFRNDASNSPIIAYTVNSGPLSSYASYYWDDIEVWSKKAAVGMLNLQNGEANVSVFPNPLSNGKLNVLSDIDLDEVKVFDITGTLRLHLKVLEDQKQINLNLDALANGLFFLTLSQNSKTIFRGKILKE